MVEYQYYTRHNWAQTVESFELNYGAMHMRYWKFDLFFKLFNICKICNFFRLKNLY